MSRLKLWLIRHGETEVNSGIWSANPAETHLTAKGKEQAANAAVQIIEPPDLFMVSPLIRARETIQPLINQWPDVPLTISPIQEFIYLSPRRLNLLSPDERKYEIKAYWQQNDPYYCDGDDAESFESFLQRISSFHQQIIQQSGYVVVVGHGQFFKAFMLGLTQGFALDSTWMRLFREKETTNSMKNGEIFKLHFN